MKNKNWSKKDMDFINKLIQKYLDKLRLDQWKVISHFVDEYKEENDMSVGAEIKTDITYLNANIWFYLPVLDNWKDVGINMLKSTIKHELCHILTEQLFNFSTQRYVEERELLHAREKLTEHISKLI